MRTCKYLEPGAENVAPRSAKKARKMIGQIVVFMYNWDKPTGVNRVGMVQDSYFSLIKISGEWSKLTSVLEMYQPAHKEQAS